MQVDTVTKTVDINSIFTQMITQEDLFACNHYESFESYIAARYLNSFVKNGSSTSQQQLFQNFYRPLFQHFCLFIYDNLTLSE
jgi:hypothetical protein